jgi:hypothetical protein
VAAAAPATRRAMGAARMQGKDISSNKSAAEIIHRPLLTNYPSAAALAEINYDQTQK